MEPISALQQRKIQGINALAFHWKVMLLEPVSALQRSYESLNVNLRLVLFTGLSEQEVSKKRVLHTGTNFRVKASRPPPPTICSNRFPHFGESLYLMDCVESNYKIIIKPELLLQFLLNQELVS
jgi:hypothetical protein